MFYENKKTYLSNLDNDFTTTTNCNKYYEYAATRSYDVSTAAIRCIQLRFNALWFLSKTIHYVIYYDFNFVS